MKRLFIITTILLTSTIWLTSCTSTRETTTTTLTPRDTLISVPPISVNQTSQDSTLIDYLYDALRNFISKNDSLSGLVDSMKNNPQIIEKIVRENIPPINKTWRDTIITERGDSAIVFHTLINNTSTLGVNVKYKPLPVRVNDTQIKTKETTELSWLGRLWQNLKEIFIFVAGMIFGVVIGFIIGKFTSVKIPFVNK